MNFSQQVPLGRTGLMVCRMGLASGYGVPPAAIEKAFHEYGVNYFYVSPIINLGSMIKAVCNLVHDHRDALAIVLARPYIGGFGGLRIEKFVERWLKKLKLEWVDLLLQGVRKPFSPKLIDRILRLKQSGKVRFVGVSSHLRPFLGTIAKGTATIPADFFHVRYNAVHRGAEEEVFPLLAETDRPGVVVFTATCWRKLLKAKLVPPDELPLTAADCYRFILSHPDVNVCLTAPSTGEQMENNLKAMAAGPLDEQEMARARRIGKYIYGRK